MVSRYRKWAYLDDMSSATEVLDEERPRRGRGRPRDPETDRRITAAASKLMLQRGFDKMTVDDVAAAAGVGKATVYRRWPSKEDLALAAMEQLYAQEIRQPDTGSIETDLRQGFHDVLTFANSAEGASFIRMSVAESVRDPRIAELYRQATQRREDMARTTLQRAIDRGEVRPDIDMDLVIQWLSGLLTLRVITHRPLPTVEKDLDELVSFVLRGIRA